MQTRQELDNQLDFNKRLNGQFFTTVNPFVNEAFVRWMKEINHRSSTPPTIIEPFAGSNNIIWMVRDLGFENSWIAYDIQPPEENNAEDVPVIALDTLTSYPPNQKIAITNPPYLAKNSATFRQMNYAGGEYEDLYQKAMEVMLNNTEYVAAILPETFIKQNLFHGRLSAVVSLPCQMFDDTNHPVCLALFVPDAEKSEKSNFDVWSGNRFIGKYKTLEKHMHIPEGRQKWTFNDPSGLIGLRGADGTKAADIQFVSGELIPSNLVKSSSRHNTRISLSGLTTDEASAIIGLANKLLQACRKATKDVFMTAHRGLREDGRYRRRLEFSQARDILDTAYEKLSIDRKRVNNDRT